MVRALVPSLVVLGLAASAGVAGPVSVVFDEPSLDRWVYPFNGTPGNELKSPIFGALGLEGFDDRDSQFLIGFDTTGQVPTGLGAAQYRVARLVVTATIQSDETFVYDPSHDALETYFSPDDPAFVPDADAGRPIELFPVGYRYGYDALTFKETSPFGGPPMVPPAEGARNAFAAVLDGKGQASDASRNVRLGFEAPPIAVGLTDDAAPGGAVPEGATFTFEVDLCATGLRPYLGQSLDQGMLHLVISSLHEAEQFGGVTYPVFYTKENPLAQEPFNKTVTLEMTVIIGDDADLNGDGKKDLFDFLAFTNLFNSGDRIADYTGDCKLDLFDFLAFVNAFNK